MKTRSLFIVCVAACAICSVRTATAVLVTFSTMPAPNVPNHSTFTFLITPGAGETVTAIEGTFTSTTMNHVWPVDPVTTPTVFQTFNFLFPTMVADDSQFEFLPPPMPPPSMFGTEDDSPGLLMGTIAGISNSMPFNLAHVVIPDGDTVFWTIETIVNNSGIEVPHIGSASVPETSQILIGGALSMVLIGVQIVRRLARRTTSPQPNG